MKSSLPFKTLQLIKELITFLSFFTIQLVIFLNLESRNPTPIGAENSPVMCSALHRCEASESCLLWFSANIFLMAPNHFMSIFQNQSVKCEDSSRDSINFVPKIEVWLTQRGLLYQHGNLTSTGFCFHVTRRIISEKSVDRRYFSSF